MNIALIHPSRGRAQMAIDTAKKWINSGSDKHKVSHILIIDGDDPACIQYDTLLLENKDLEIDRFTAIGCNNVVEATNIGAKVAYEKHNADVLVYLSDDFNRPPQNWDELIIKKVHDVTGGGAVTISAAKWLLKVNDGVQDPNHPVLTIPIMSRGLYEFRGKNFWHPEYKSMWVDVDLFFECHEFIIEARDILFQHDHPTWCGSYNKADDTYNRSSLNWNQGARIFNRRKLEFGWIWEDARILDSQP